MNLEVTGRRHRRKRVLYPAWLERRGSLLPCTVVNVANKGAQLCITEDMVLPSRFALWFTKEGDLVRQCRLIWRKGDRVGVTFDAV